MYEGLPEFCFGVLNTTNEVILIKRGERGYWRFHDGAYQGEEQARQFNDEIGVTPAQQEAMEAGSLFGWHVPAANPELYDENGKHKK